MAAGCMLSICCASILGDFYFGSMRACWKIISRHRVLQKGVRDNVGAVSTVG